MGLVSFDITCPHCLKERAVIEAFAEKQIEKTPLFNVAFVCRSCHRGGVAIVEIPSDHYHGPMAESQKKDLDILISGNSQYRFRKIYPAVKKNYRTRIYAPGCRPYFC
ncbi:TPA: hypothetical protein ACHGKB_003380 [Escherichia coli]